MTSPYDWSAGAERDRLVDLTTPGLEPRLVERVRGVLIVGHQPVEVGRGEVEDPHVGVRRLDPVTPESNVLDARDDPREQPVAEQLDHCGALSEIEHLLGVVAELLPDFDTAEPIAHQITSLDDELFAF